MALKTDYIDDVFTGSRKYQEIINEDNTKSFLDRTVYTRNGTRFGAKDINDTNTAINKLYKPREFNLISGSWVRKSNGLYEYSIDIQGIKETDEVTLCRMVDIRGISGVDEIRNYNKNFALIVGGKTENNKVILAALKKPSINIKIGLKGV